MGNTDATKSAPKLSDDIIQAAADVFARKGYHGTSVTDLCAVVGVSRATLYYYVGSKDKLLAEIHAYFIEPLIQRLDAAIRAASDPADALTRFSRELMATISARQSLVTVFFDQFTPRQTGEEVYGVESKRRQLSSMLEDVIEAGKRDGTFRDVDTKITALAFLGMHNWSVRWYRSEGALGSHEISDRFMGLFVEGILTSPGNHAPGPPPTPSNGD